jgi:hypothetical protein
VFAKPVVADLYIVHNEEFSVTAICAIRTLDKRRSIFIIDTPILSSERMLHKDYDRKASLTKKICGRDPRWAWRQDGLIGSKPSVIK